MRTGTTILGQISAISSLDLVISLPNNLSGYASITRISKEFSAQLESDHESENGSTAALGEQETKQLSDLFVVGQWIRCAVISATQDSSKKALRDNQKKRIELSLEPELVNKGLTPEYAQNRSLIQASIKSIEDHGLIVNIGLQDCQGFIKKKEYGSQSPSSITVGQVFLCSITAAEGDRRVLQLSADLQKNPKRLKLKSITNIDALLPGDGVEVVIAEAHQSSFSGKISGLIDATCDSVQAGSFSSASEVDFKEGNKVFARVISVDPESEPRRVGVSLLHHVLQFESVSSNAVSYQNPLDAIPIGFNLEKVTVQHIEPKLGLFCNIGVENIFGFVHISRVSEGKIESLSPSSGKYKIGSEHPARVIGFSAADGMFVLSLEQKVIEAKYLTHHDVHIGETLQGTVKKFVAGGMIVQINENINGFVPEMHIADVKLQAPEKKFKEGSTVKCRVLDTDVERRRITLTLKKSLVNSDGTVFSSLGRLSIGDKSSGVITKLFDNGALIQFYGGVHAFLPSSEMSEAFINDPREHFKVGQTLAVRVLKIDVTQGKMTVSCKDSAAWDDSKVHKFTEIEPGQITSATVTEKTKDRLVILLQSGFTGIIEVGHMSDGDFARCDKLFQKTRSGAHLKEVVVLDRHSAQRQLVMSMKATLIKAAKEGSLLSRFEDLSIGREVKGYVRKVADYGLLIGFAGGLTGLALKHNLSEQYVSMPGSLFSASQSVSCRISEIDLEQKRFQVSFKQVLPISGKTGETSTTDASNTEHGAHADFSELIPGTIVEARIRAIKDTQLNIVIAGEVQGRVDISSIYDSFEDISNPRRPLKCFEVGQEITVKIIGYHDAKNHRFLPLSHRQTNAKTILECTLKPSEMKNDTARPLSFEDVRTDATYLAFVNNFANDCLWVNISPVVRGRVKLLDLETNLTTTAELQNHYSNGSAIQCRVLHFSAPTKHLDLTERMKSSQTINDFADIAIGSTYPVKITKVLDSGIMAQLSDSISGRISLTDISSNYKEDPTKPFKKNDLLQVVVKSIDINNKQVALSLRNSSDKIVDPEIGAVSDLELGKQYRGYIKNVADQGLFIELGRNVVARVKIAETSDAFIKDWKKGFIIRQLIVGKVIAIDAKQNRVEFSLKKHAKAERPQNGLSSLNIGQVVEATLKKIEDFGVFVQVNSVSGVSGLCHKSEIADAPVKDINAIYSVGDLVKAKILAIDTDKRRISFGLKSSYFTAEAADSDEHMSDANTAQSDIEADDSESDDDSVSSDVEVESEPEGESEEETSMNDQGGLGQADGPLTSTGFDWTGNSVFQDSVVQADSESESEVSTKKKAKKSKKSYDDSAVDFSAKKPESVSDFERLVLGDPDSSNVWINYMAFHMQLSDFEAARSVADRALKTINYRREAEKLNIWLALINLENNFGTEESLESTFKRSCEFNDPQEMYSRLVGAFIRSQKINKAIETYDTMTKKFSHNPKIWVEYANFLASHDRLEDSRDLLPKSLKSLPKSEHISTMEQFAILEFKKGDAERGRTLFEGLLSSYPKRLDLWMVLIDQESSQSGSQQVIRKLFDRVMGTKMSMKKAKSVFKKWLAYEKEHGTDADVENVKARAVEYVESH